MSIIQLHIQPLFNVANKQNDGVPFLYNILSNPPWSATKKRMYDESAINISQLFQIIAPEEHY